MHLDTIHILRPDFDNIPIWDKEKATLELPAKDLLEADHHQAPSHAYLQRKVYPADPPGRPEELVQWILHNHSKLPRPVLVEVIEREDKPTCPSCGQHQGCRMRDSGHVMGCDICGWDLAKELEPILKSVEERDQISEALGRGMRDLGSDTKVISLEDARGAMKKPALNIRAAKKTGLAAALNMRKVHRNRPCPCGSGKRYRECCK